MAKATKKHTTQYVDDSAANAWRAQEPYDLRFVTTVRGMPLEWFAMPVRVIAPAAPAAAIAPAPATAPTPIGTLSAHAWIAAEIERMARCGKISPSTPKAVVGRMLEEHRKLVAKDGVVERGFTRRYLARHLEDWKLWPI